MRNLLLLVALLVCDRSVHASIAVTAKAGCSVHTPTSSATCTIASGIANGSLVNLTIDWGNVTTSSCVNPTVTDSSGGQNTWKVSSTLARWPAGGFNFCGIQMYAIVTGLTAANSTITVTVSPSAGNELDLGYIIATGVNKTNPIDCFTSGNPGNQTVNTSTANTAYTSSSPCTLASGGDLMVGQIMFGGGAPTAGTGYTVYDANGTLSEYIIQGAAGTYNLLYTANGSQTWATLDAAFAPDHANDVYVTTAGGTSGGCTTNVQTPTLINTAGNYTAGVPSGSTQIGPGTIVHLCGPFIVSGSTSTPIFSPAGSGTAAQPIWFKTEVGFTVQGGEFLSSFGSNTGTSFNISNQNFITVGGATPCGAVTPGVFAPSGQNCDGNFQHTGYGSGSVFNGTTNAQAGLMLINNCNGCEIKNLAFLNAYQRVTNFQLTSISCTATTCTLTCASNCPIASGTSKRIQFISHLNPPTLTCTGIGCNVVPILPVTTSGNTMTVTGTFTAGTDTDTTTVPAASTDWLNLYVSDETVTDPSTVVGIFFNQCTNISIHDNYFSDAGWLLRGNLTGNGIKVFNNYFNNYDHGLGMQPGNNSVGTSGFDMELNYFGSRRLWDDGPPFNNSNHHDPFHSQLDLNGNPQDFWLNPIINANRFAGDSGFTDADLFLRASQTGGVVSNNVFQCSPARYFTNPKETAFGDTQNRAGPSLVTNPTFINNTSICTGNYANGGAVIGFNQPFSVGITRVNNILAGQKAIVSESGTPAQSSITSSDFNLIEDITKDSGGTVGVHLFNWPGNFTDCIKAAVCSSQSGAITSPVWQTYEGTGNDNNSLISTFTGMLLDGNGQPQTGSPAINAGQNLTSSWCGTYPQVCKDIAGNSRPSSGLWFIGAYQVAGGSPSTAVTFTPSPVNIGLVPVGLTSNAISVTLQNTGSATLTNTSITLSNALFTIVSNTCGSPATITNLIPGTGFSLGVGASCTFGITASPIAAGPITANAVFTENTVGGSDTLVLNANATGAPAPSITIFAGNLVLEGSVLK